MAFLSLKQFLARMGLATPEQFDEWSKAWKVAVASGSQETLLAFICRERGLAEDVFLQQLSQALNWPYLDLPKLAVPAEARSRVSTKVAFQYSVLPTQVSEGTLEVAHLAPGFGGAPVARPAPSGGELQIPGGYTIEQAERALIELTLEHTKGNKTRASEILGISQKTLFNKLKEYGAQGAGAG